MDLVIEAPTPTPTFTTQIVSSNVSLTSSTSSLTNLSETMLDKSNSSLQIGSLKMNEPNLLSSTIVPLPGGSKVDLIQNHISSILDNLSLTNSNKSSLSSSLEDLASAIRPNSGISSSIDAECEAFCRHINSILSIEKLPTSASKYLPLEVSDFFERLRDGVILALLINSINPGMIPISSINIGVEISYSSSSSASSYKALHNANENLRLVLKAAKNLGSIHLVNIGTEDILSGNKSIVLGLIWQLIRSWYIAGVNNSPLDSFENKEKKEASPKDLSAEGILIRWINDTINLEQPIMNLGADLADCKAYAILLDTILIDANMPSNDSMNTLLEVIELEPDYKKRAALIVESLLPTLPYVRAEDLSNARLNLCIIADLFKFSQSQAKINAKELKISRVEISGWEATLEAERSLYASQLASLSEQHSMEVELLENKLVQTQFLLKGVTEEWEEKMDNVGVSIAALATRVNQLCPEDGRNHLPLSVLLQNNSTHLELIAYCQTQLDLIEAYQTQLLEDKSKLYTTISLNKHVNELMSARVREFSQELAAKKKANTLSLRRSNKSSFKEKILSWTSSSSPNNDPLPAHCQMVPSTHHE